MSKKYFDRLRLEDTLNVILDQLSYVELLRLETTSKDFRASIEFAQKKRFAKYKEDLLEKKGDYTRFVNDYIHNCEEYFYCNDFVASVFRINGQKVNFIENMLRFIRWVLEYKDTACSNTLHPLFLLYTIENEASLSSFCSSMLIDDKSLSLIHISRKGVSEFHKRFLQKTFKYNSPESWMYSTIHFTRSERLSALKDFCILVTCGTVNRIMLLNIVDTAEMFTFQDYKALIKTLLQKRTS